MKTRSYLSFFFILSIFISSCQKEEVMPQNLTLDDFESARNSGGPADLSTGLFAYYPFSGNANDESGNSLNGAPLNLMLTSDRKGKKNAAYYFENKVTDSRIELPEDSRFSLTNDFTISLWIMPTEYAEVSISTYKFISILTLLDRYKLLAGLAASSPPVFNLGFETTTFNQAIGLSANLVLNQWKHYTVTYEKNSGTIRHYINGELVSEKVGQILNLSVAFRSVIVGGYFNFTGKLDELRFYNRPLSAFDVKTLARQ